MHLLEKRDRVLTLPALEDRLVLLDEEIQEAQDDVSNLLRRYKKESRDVEQLQKESLSAFLLRLVGKYEDKLEKKQLEEINAKLAYDCAATHLDNLTQEKHELASRILALKSEEKTLNSELENRRAKITQQLTEPQGIRYAELENKRSVIISQITKLEEALRVATLADSTAQEIAASLDRAEGWATFDIFVSGILVHMAKYSHIDDAEKNFHILSSRLRELMYELRDIDNLSIPSLNEISSTQRTIDFWFNNIFTSLSVREKIQDNSQEISQLLITLSDIKAALESKLKVYEDSYTHNKRYEEELLLSI